MRVRKLEFMKPKRGKKRLSGKMAREMSHEVYRARLRRDAARAEAQRLGHYTPPKMLRHGAAGSFDPFRAVTSPNP